MQTLKLRNGETVTYRRLQQGDEARLQAFHAALSEESKRLFTPHAYDDATLSRLISQAEADEHRVYLVLDADETIVAYFFLWWYDTPFPVLGIGIADACQGQGLGKKLMQILIEDGRKKGCQAIELTTMLDNQRAFALYEKVGFKCAGQVKNKTGDGRMVTEWHLYYPFTKGVVPPPRTHESPV